MAKVNPNKAQLTKLQGYLKKTQSNLKGAEKDRASRDASLDKFMERHNKLIELDEQLIAVCNDRISELESELEDLKNG